MLILIFALKLVYYFWLNKYSIDSIDKIFLIFEIHIILKAENKEITKL